MSEPLSLLLRNTRENFCGLSTGLRIVRSRRVFAELSRCEKPDFRAVKIAQSKINPSGNKNHGIWRSAINYHPMRAGRGLPLYVDDSAVLIFSAAARPDRNAPSTFGPANASPAKAIVGFEPHTTVGSAQTFSGPA